MTNISELSWDLVEKILYRVPISSIGAVRSTCKLLNRLSKYRILCKAEARRHQFLRFMVKNYKLCSLGFDLHGILDDEEFVDPSIKEIISYSLTKEKESSSLVVWNPYLGQTRWIQPRHNYHRLDMYALGYDSNSRNHKILRFLDDEDDYDLGNPVIVYEIYDFSSDSWRVIDINPDWDIIFFQRGVSLKGNTYFLATDKYVAGIAPAEIPQPHDYLLCFDFTRERFGQPLPLPFEHYNDDTGALSSLRDEQLAALYQCSSMSEVEIWVTTKIEPNAVSWAPFLKIDTEPLTGFEFQFHIDGASFFIDEEKKIAVVFQLDDQYSEDHLQETRYDNAYLIGENGYFEKVGLGEAVNPPQPNNLGEYCPLVCSCSYVPSLVHINQFA